MIDINNRSRRSFLKKTSVWSGSVVIGFPFSGMTMENNREKASRSNMIEIQKVNSNFVREPLIRPFGFKGGFLTEIWQTISWLQSANGKEGLGLGSQSVLWSDSSVFSSHSEAGGNALMYAITERALQMIQGETFRSPVQLQETILEDLYQYGCRITSNPQLRMTFVLNALVGVDLAVWILFARENNLTNFDQIIPSRYKEALSQHLPQVASVPTIAYTIPVSEIKQAVDAGHFMLKIKLGQPGNQKEMLEKDMERLSLIHNTIGDRTTHHTPDGKIPYYFDMNGRYETKETLLRLFDHTKKIGAFEQIVIVEEPFPEQVKIDVRDIEARLVADESAHTDKDALERIQMGYSAIALKAIAKTLSMTMKIAEVARIHKVPCLCADLTVNPILVEWNKTIACRLAPFPGYNMGLMETNGHQNYKNWNIMRSYHPYHDATWTKQKDGVFVLDADFYKKSGGIFEISGHYLDLVASG
jgi:L-alanine-DL-glutamate epimerase-like enolase superfamily enzyme